MLANCEGWACCSVQSSSSHAIRNFRPESAVPPSSLCHLMPSLLAFTRQQSSSRIRRCSVSETGLHVRAW